MEVRIKEYAIFEAERRGISKEFIKFTVNNWHQKLLSKKGCVIVQNKHYD